MNTQLASFIDDLRSTHGSNLVSVILYGSAAAGDFIPNRSDYNILITLKRITPSDLRNSFPCIREWHHLGHPIPVYFSLDEIAHAADVFPIEFRQMTIAHRVLFGTDVLAGLDISDAFLRHQAEYELRSKLILLRRQYIPASSSVDKLKALMSDSLTSFSALFRAVLILHGIEPPATKHEIVALTVDKLALDGAVFEKIFNIRENNFAGTLDEVAANNLFGSYLIQIENVISAVDQLGKR